MWRLHSYCRQTEEAGSSETSLCTTSHPGRLVVMSHIAKLQCIHADRHSRCGRVPHPLSHTWLSLWPLPSVIIRKFFATLRVFGLFIHLTRCSDVLAAILSGGTPSYAVTAVYCWGMKPRTCVTGLRRISVVLSSSDAQISGKKVGECGTVMWTVLQIIAFACYFIRMYWRIRLLSAILPEHFDRITALPQNVGNPLPSDAASYTGRAETLVLCYSLGGCTRV